jgi:hypothetical protein
MYYSRSFILNGKTDQDYDTVVTSTFSGIKMPENYVCELVSHAHSRLSVEVFGIHKLLAVMLRQ